MDEKRFWESREKDFDYERKRRNKWRTWIIIVGCVGLLCMVGISLFGILKFRAEPEGEVIYRMFPIGSRDCVVPVGEYEGLYRKVRVSDTDLLSGSDILSARIGKMLAGTETWYYLLGHADMQYLIQNENGEYSLWKFLCFKADEYPYRDVLELIYQIDSADKISEIKATAPYFDRSESGRETQAEIGDYTVTDRTEIEKFYEILVSLTCYGREHVIDYIGDEENHEGMWLGRYLTLIANYEYKIDGFNYRGTNKIAGLQYTGVSDMFYEDYGIAYNRLTEEQAESVCKILKIDMK